jgi:hypothetical protein
MEELEKEMQEEVEEEGQWATDCGTSGAPLELAWMKIEWKLRFKLIVSFGLLEGLRMAEHFQKITSHKICSTYLTLFRSFQCTGDDI